MAARVQSISLIRATALNVPRSPALRIASQRAFSSTPSRQSDNEILQKIKDELKAAMKGKQTEVVATLKSLLSEHQYSEKSGSTSSTILSLIRKGITRRTEAAEQFKSANRDDLAEKESSQVSLLEKFLPSQMKDEDLRKLIEEAMNKLKEEGVDSKKILGGVIRQVKEQAEGKVDGKRLKEAVDDFMKKL